jgi:8-oxo-dGTP diphosphatase
LNAFVVHFTLGLFVMLIQATGLAKRLRLVPMEAENASEVQRLGDDTEVFRYIPSVPVPFEASSWIEKSLANSENYIRHLIRLARSNVAIGYVQINRRRNLNFQLGYWLGKQHWGSGYATEAAASALLLLHAAGAKGLVFAASFSQNAASVAVLRKLGFVQCPINPHAGVEAGMVDHVIRLG